MSKIRFALYQVLVVVKLNHDCKHKNQHQTNPLIQKTLIYWTIIEIDEKVLNKIMIAIKIFNITSKMFGVNQGDKEVSVATVMMDIHANEANDD